MEAFPDYAEGETLVVLRSSHTCLPRSAVEALVWRAESEKKNIFFGAGWVLVNGEDKSEAKYVPLKAGAAVAFVRGLSFRGGMSAARDT